MKRLPSRLAPLLFGFLLSGLMSLMVSGISTWRTLGLVEGFGSKWLTNWMSSWMLAFPAVLIVAPLVRRVVARLCEAPAR